MLCAIRRELSDEDAGGATGVPQRSAWLVSFPWRRVLGCATSGMTILLAASHWVYPWTS